MPAEVSLSFDEAGQISVLELNQCRRSVLFISCDARVERSSGIAEPAKLLNAICGVHIAGYTVPRSESSLKWSVSMSRIAIACREAGRYTVGS